MTDDDSQPFERSLTESQHFTKSLFGRPDEQDPFGDSISLIQDPPATDPVASLQDDIALVVTSDEHGPEDD